MLDIKEYLKQTKTVLLTHDAFDELMQRASAEPEIIRCKDCEYFHKSFCEIWSKFGTIQTRENGYCYMAERRMDE